jgi:hypothetical protein
MAKLKLDETETAEIALKNAWNELAPVVERAKELKEAVAEKPELAEQDPEVYNYVRWFDTFNQELAAIQTLQRAAPDVPAEDLRAARKTAEELLGAVAEVAPKFAGAGSAPQAEPVLEQSAQVDHTVT